MKGTSQIKPRLGQGRTGLRQKIKTSMPPLLNKATVKLKEKPVGQPKVNAKVPIPESSRMHDTITPIPDYTIPQTSSCDDSSSRMVKRKIIQDISREIPMHPDPIYRSFINQQKYPSQKFLEMYQILTQKLIQTLKKFHHFKKV